MSKEGPMARYSRDALETDLGVPAGTPPFVYLSLCICGEAGELAEKVKKAHRDRGGLLNAEDLDAMVLECGDILWYLNAFAEQLRDRLARFGAGDRERSGCTLPGWLLNEPHAGLEMIATANIQKLRSRQSRGVLHGSGDKR